MVERLFANICCDDLAGTREFYTRLFGMEVSYDSDWFVHLVDRDPGRFELGLVKRDHAVVPERARGDAGGWYLTFVVADVDVLHARAIALGASVLESPRLMVYGQKRMLVVDPAGNVLDVSSVSGEKPA